MLSWESGTFEFEDGVLPKGAVDLKLSTERLLLAAVQRVPDRSFALRHVDLATVLEPEPAGEAALSEVRAEVWPLLERLDGTRTLKDAIALTRLDEFEAAKTACAMLFLGVLRRKAAVAEELDLAQEAQSGFGADPAPMYTVPVEAIRPAPESTGFAFAEPEPEVPAAVPEPPDAADTLVFPFASAEPEPEPEPFAPVFSTQPDAIPEAPSFTIDTPRPHKVNDTVPGDRPVYVPPVYVPPVMSHPSMSHLSPNRRPHRRTSPPPTRPPHRPFPTSPRPRRRRLARPRKTSPRSMRCSTPRPPDSSPRARWRKSAPRSGSLSSVLPPLPRARCPLARRPRRARACRSSSR